MPIPVEELKKYEGFQELEIQISKFLENRRGEALTDDEITEGLQRGFSIEANAKKLAKFLEISNEIN